VEVFADARGRGHDVEDVIAEVAGEACDETKALDRGDFIVNALEELREGGGAGSELRVLSSEFRVLSTRNWELRTRNFIARNLLPCRPDLWELDAVHRDCGAVGVDVVVDGLAEERDFDDACVSEFLAFINDGLRRAMDFSAAGIGHDAIGAELVAAARDAHVCRALTVLGKRIGIERAREVEQFKVVVCGVECCGATRVVALERDAAVDSLSECFFAIGFDVCGLCLLGFDSVVDEDGELVELTRAAHEIDLREAADHVSAFAFSHASDHAQDEVGAVFFSQAHEADAAPDFVFRLLANRTCVVKDDVGVVGIGGEPIAEGGQVAAHQFAVELIHLAAEGFQINGSCSGFAVALSGIGVVGGLFDHRGLIW
jgi:hypothetical protein